MQRLYNEAQKALKLADVQTAMTRQGMEPQAYTPPELAARIRKETAMWAELVRKTGIRAD